MQSHLHTTLKLWGRGIGLRSFVTDYLKKITKESFEAGICQKNIYDNFCYSQHEAMFSDQV